MESHTHARRVTRPGLVTRLRHEAHGMFLVFLALGMMSFMAATMLAVDVGMLMNARTEAQRAADAGALAGAVALVFDDYADRSATGPAVQNAIMAATANDVMHQTTSVTPADVTFPLDPTGQPNRVRVQAYRTGGRGNPLSTMVASYFGTPTADVDAIATAEAAPANAATCIKPWAVPDKWIEVQTPAWDPTDTFDMFFNNGTPLPNPDIYVPTGNPGYTGYNPDPLGPDYGWQVTLKPGNPHQAINPGHFFPIALPPNTGAAWYEQNIPGCWPGIMMIGDWIPMEPGNMIGPTSQGTQALINKDPGAYWDTANNKIVSTYHPSPRVIVIPVFDPAVYETGRQSGRLDIQVANLVGFFVEGISGNNVTGRLVPTVGLITGGGPVPGGAFLRAIRLVQ